MTFRQIGDKIRIESGPARLTALATPELLDDAVTAAHYQLPRAASPEEIADPTLPTPDGKVRALDALGVPIEEGREMTYLDWKGHAVGASGSTVFYVYAFEPMTEDEIAERGLRDRPDWADLGDEGQRALTMIWREIGVDQTEDEAIARATDYLVANG